MIGIDKKEVTAEASDVLQLFDAHQAKSRKVSLSNVKDRKAKLRSLERSILKHRDAICEGMHRDFNKPAT